MVITPATRANNLLCTTTSSLAAPTATTYSWKDLITDSVLGTEDRLDLSSLCRRNNDTAVDQSPARRETRYAS